MSAAKQYQDRPVSFSIGDRVGHIQHGDGMITGTYGSKLAVDFDRVGTKRVSPETISLAAWMPPETLAAILVERDARRAAARAAYGLVPPQVVVTPQTAEIIEFPRSRIVREVRHGKPVVATTIK
jgi:hypothetical protein